MILNIANGSLQVAKLLEIRRDFSPTQTLSGLTRVPIICLTFICFIHRNIFHLLQPKFFHIESILIFQSVMIQNPLT